MPSSDTGISPKAIGWALLSQVFWLPLVAIDLHDRWVAHQRDITPPGKALPPSPIARATPFSINDLLGAAKPVQQLASQANQAVSGALGQAVNGAQGAVSSAGVLLSSAGSSASSLLDRPFSVSLDAPSPRGLGSTSAATGRPTPESSLSLAHPANTLLGRAFTRAQLLGGSIGLADLNEGPMAPLALAEQAIQRGSGDPLAPLPSLLREPMRQALLKLPGAPRQIGPARVVHVPSSRISQPTDVPLAIQSDGSVDILEAPANPAVLREIDAWSRQQRLPATGSLVPAVIHLHPLPEAAPITPPASTRVAPVAPARAVEPAPVPARALEPAAELSAPAPEPAAMAPVELTPPPPLPPVAEAAPAPIAPAELAAPAPAAP